ncbi:MAG: MlaD family protein [Planctomycetia bacterium]|nr:MlaD family protein [Planctomycetia bacterium]
MDERILQARVGIMVISAMLLTAILTVLFGKFTWSIREGKTIYITFPSAPGVTEGTPVRKSGLLIGRVDGVSLIKGSSDVMVTVRLNSGVDINDDQVCRITTASILGDALLEFVKKPSLVGEPPGTDHKPIPNGDRMAGMVSANPLELMTALSADLPSTLQKVGNAGTDISRLANNVNRLLEGKDTGRLDRVLEKTEAAMENFQRAMANINEIVGDEKVRGDLKKSLASMPQIMDETHKTITGMQKAVNRADKNMENLEHLTGPLGEHGAEMAARLDSSITQLDTFMRQLVQFTSKFNEQQGTLSQLMNNPELYNQLTAAAKNVNQLTTQIRPILADVRVFSDKIARDPGQLGLSGAMQRNKNGTKYPNYGTVQPPPADWREPQIIPAPAIDSGNDPVIIVPQP